MWNQIIESAPLLSIKIINLMRGRKEEGREGTDMKMLWRMINPFVPLVHYTVHTLKLSFLSLYKCWLQSANEKSSYRSRDFFWFTSNASIGPTVQSVANNMERQRKFILVIKQLVIYSENHMYKCITIKNLIILCLNYVYAKFEKFFF